MSDTVNPGEFTRATTATSEDHQGKQVSVLSNEPRMIGSRRVRNLITASEDMTNGAYAVGGNAVVDSATQVTFDGTANGRVTQLVTITDDGSGAGGRTFVATAEIALVSGVISTDADVQFIMTGNAISDVTVNIGSELTTTPQRFSVTASTDAAGTGVSPRVDCEVAATLEITKWQLEEVTGNISHAPSEYVSTGIGTGSELYTTSNAAGDDTDATTGLVSIANGTITSVADGNGSTYAVEVESNTSNGAGGGAYQELGSALSLVTGKDYVLEFDAKHVGTGGDYIIGLNEASTIFFSGMDDGYITLTNSDTTYQTYRIPFTYSSADNDFLAIRELNAGNDGGARIDNISVKEADHGLNRDGVKAFPYHNGNTPAIRKFLDLDGTGDYASSSDGAALPANNITLIAGIRPDSWNPAGEDCIISRWASSNIGFAFNLDNASSRLKLYVSDDGTTNQNAISDTNHTLTDATFAWVRATFDDTTNKTSFYYSLDPRDTALASITWTQIGSPVAMSGDLDGIYASTADYEIGTALSGSNPYAGQVFEAAIIDGTDATATPAVHFNAEDHTSGSTLTSSTTGEVWTFQNDAFIDYEETGVVTEAQGPAINSSTSQWVELDGASGTYVSSPDSASAPTDDMAIIAWLAPDDWTPAAAMAYNAKWETTGNQRSWVAQIRTDGKIRLTMSANGTTTAYAESTVATGFSDGTGHWVALTVDNSEDTLNFFTSDQPLGTPLSELNWVQLGEPDVPFSAALGGPYDGTAAFEIGSTASGTANTFTGKIGRNVIIDSTDLTATPVVDFNTNDYEAGKTWEASGQQTEFVGTAAFDATDATDASTPDSTYTVSGNTVTGVVDGVSAIRYRHNGIATVAGKRYTVTVTESGSVNTTFQVGTTLGGTDILNTVASSASTSVFEFTATSATSYITLSVAGNFIVTFDSIIEHADIWTLNGTARVFSPFAAWGDLPGSSGDYFSTPDSAAASFTGDIDMIVRAALDDWTPATPNILYSHFGGAGQRAFYFAVGSDGSLFVEFSIDGTNTDVASSVSATGFSDGTMKYVRFKRDASSGAVSFYAGDSIASLVQLGDTATETSGNLHNSTSAIEIGSRSSGTIRVLSGKVSRVMVFDQLDGYGNAAPVIDFDARTFTPGVTTATASTGEVWTANGNVSIEQNIPSPWDASGPLGYLSEQAGTNLALYSTPGNLGTTWTDTNATPVANYAIAPDGTKTAVRLIDDGATGTGVVSLQQNLTVSSGASTYSWHVKADQLGMCVIRIENFDGTANGLSYFNMSTGAWGTVSSNHTVHDPVPTAYGYYRVAVTFTTTSDLAGTARIHVASTDGSTTVDLDGTSSILVWGAQVESGSFPTTYIPTTSSATRNADVLTYSAVGNADTDPATITAEVTLNTVASTAQLAYSIDDGTANNRSQVASSGGSLSSTIYATNSGSALINESGSIPIAGVPKKYTAVFANNDFEFYEDSLSVATDTSGDPSTDSATTIRVGQAYNDTAQPYATIRNVKIFNKRLNDSQVKNL
jgi:hypothetical protein